ncbi:hypothetical protein [Paraburkholderia hospita]|uniref:hypothetical protein n=1 Tax=Paraburkholderia hospita TaxID=169430 RepID=UPI003ECC9670
MTSESDFIGKLLRTDPQEAHNANPLFFVGIHVGAADGEPEPKQKIARRAIEAELHRRFALDPMPVSPARILLSSPPPVPVGHKFEFDKIEIAKSVYNLIAEEYRKWLTTTNMVEVCIRSNTRSGSALR